MEIQSFLSLAVILLAYTVAIGEAARFTARFSGSTSYRSYRSYTSYRSYRSYRSYGYTSYNPTATRYTRAYRGYYGYYSYYYAMYFGYRPGSAYYMNRNTDTSGSTVCSNYEANDNGTTIGEFACPMPFEPAEFTYCCGESYAQYCCKFEDRGDLIAGIVVGTLLIIAIIAGIAVCIWCCCKSAKKVGPTGNATVQPNRAPPPNRGAQPVRPPAYGRQPPPGYGNQPRPMGYGQQPPPPGYGQQPPPAYGQSGHGQPSQPGYGQPVAPGYGAHGPPPYANGPPPAYPPTGDYSSPPSDQSTPPQATTASAPTETTDAGTRPQGLYTSGTNADPPPEASTPAVST